MKKYEFIKKSTDMWCLKYGNTEIEYKTDIELQKRAQGIQKQAKVKMIMDLTKQGISAKELEIEIKEGAKTIIDETNKRELLEAYLEEASVEFLEDACLLKLKKRFSDLVEEIGLKLEKEVEKFTEDFALTIQGKTPR